MDGECFAARLIYSREQPEMMDFTRVEVFQSLIAVKTMKKNEKSVCHTAECCLQYHINMIKGNIVAIYRRASRK